jgi:phosphoglycolate phosphatase
MNLLFDLDGTLTDSYQGITRCISHALIMMGRPTPLQKDLRWCIGPPLKSSLAKLLASDSDTIVEKALAFYRQRFGSVGLFENKVYDDIPEALNGLRQAGHTLYVATSKAAVYAERIIAHFGLGGCFKRIYGSELDGTRGDKASLIRYILESESINSSDAFMIGDREHDMIGAGANGIRGLGVLWGYGSLQELQASGALACITHPRELVGALNGQQNFQNSDPA